MNINLIIFVSIIYLFGINYFLRKFDISLDKSSKNEIIGLSLLCCTFLHNLSSKHYYTLTKTLILVIYFS